MELNFLLLNDEIILWKSSFAMSYRRKNLVVVSQEDY